MTRFTDEEILKAIENFINKKRKENEEFSINDIRKRDFEFYNGNNIPIGERLSEVRSGNSYLSKLTINKLINDFGLDLTKKYYKPTDEEYFEAIDNWLELNPNKNINDITRREKIILKNGHEVELGTKLSMMRRGRNYLSKENMIKLVNNYGLILDLKDPKTHHMTPDDIFFKALDKWLEENKGKTVNDIKDGCKVEIDGEIINIGSKIYRIKLQIRSGRKDFVDKLINKYGLSFEKDFIPSMKNYLVAIDKWLEENENSTINDITFSTIVNVDGKDILVGEKLNRLRWKNKKIELTENDKNLIKILKFDYGFSLEKEKKEIKNENKEKIKKEKVKLIPDEIYMQAFDKWLEENKGKTLHDVTRDEEVEINGKVVKIGSKLCQMRLNKALLSEDNMKILEEKGFKYGHKDLPNRIPDEIYFKGFDKWLEKNKGKTINDIKPTEEIMVDGEIVKIGSKLTNMRSGNSLLSEENMKILETEYHFISGNKADLKKKIYEKNLILALDKWLEENKGKTINDILNRQVVLINNKKIRLGEMLVNIRRGKKEISKETRILLDNKYKLDYSLKKVFRGDEIFFKAFDKWLEENPGLNINYIADEEKIELDGELIPIGSKLGHIKSGVAFFSPENMEILTKKYGFVFDNKKEYVKPMKILKAPIFKAIDKWLKLNPGKDINEISCEEIVNVNGKEIDLGIRINRIKNKLCKLKKTEMEKLINEYGIILIDKNAENKKATENDYKEAIDEWLKLNPNKTINDIGSQEVIEINGRSVWIGVKLCDIRGERLKVSDEFLNLLIEQYGLNIGNKIDIKRENNYKKILLALDKWLEENSGKTINDIVISDTVLIGNIEFPIGSRISGFKSKYKTSRSIEQEKEFVELLIEEYGLSLENKKEKGKIYSGEEYLKAVDKWLEDNPGKNINEIAKNEIVYIGEDKISLGSKISKMKASKNLLPEKYMKILKEKYGFIQEKRLPSGKISDEEWIKVIEKWLEINVGKTINQIKYDERFNIFGKEYRIGIKISEIRNGRETMGEETIKVLIEKYGLKTLDNETGFAHDIEPLRKEKTIIKEKPYEKYLDESNGDIEKAKEKYNRILEVKRRLREEKRNKKRPDVSLDEILKYFDIDMEKLDKLLNRVSERESTSPVIKYEEGETLRNYCIRNGYNYSVIYYLYNHTTGRDIDSLIEQYRINGQKKPTNEIYTNKDGEILAKHLLLYLGLDFESISRDTKVYDYTFGEAIRNDVFRRNITKNEDKWLEEIYDDLIDQVNEDKSSEKISEDLINVLVTARQNLNGLLTSEEYEKVVNVFVKYIETMRKYCKLCVGLEKNSLVRKQLIKDNKLDEHDVTEGTLMALDFELGIKRTDKSLESKRLETLKPLIINWNKYNQEQKDKMAEQFKLTESEVFMIIRYNSEIRYNLQLIKK